MKDKMSKVLSSFPNKEEKFDYFEIIFQKTETNSEEKALEITFKDFNRNNFIINGIHISSLVTAFLKNTVLNEVVSIDELLKEYKEGRKREKLKKQLEYFYELGNKIREKILSSNQSLSNKKQILIECFKAMFKYVNRNSNISDSIIEELILNCNQAYYQFIPYREFCAKNGLFILAPEYKVIIIEFISFDCLNLEIKMLKSKIIQVGERDPEELLNEDIFVSSSLSFKISEQKTEELQLSQIKEKVKYSDGKLVAEFSIKNSSSFIGASIKYLMKVLLYIPNLLYSIFGFETLDQKRKKKFSKIYTFREQNTELQKNVMTESINQSVTKAKVEDSEAEIIQEAEEFKSEHNALSVSKAEGLNTDCAQNLEN